MGAKLLSVETVFGEAMEIAAPAERAAFLDLACGGDSALRRQVESLLDAHTRADGFLEAPASIPTITVAATPRDEGPSGVIGPYRLLEEIGEGGMGTVYMAEQSHPVRRKVALKVIKAGMDTRQVVARFEAERQALALMDHPNIARVLDAGATRSGSPYFVMELVRGLPITEYCDREALTVPERLELFVLACRAVQHAHQKGVVHRDLKPSNILVTVIDGVPTPKVIDFGVAKATGASLTERSLFTGFHQMIGTPLYMSPEQADLSSADVDTRSDIYSLGVLLYELLTGSTPFDRDTFAKAAFDEMRRIIREDEPPTPSTRLGSLGEKLTTVSARRGSDPRRLNRAVRGELDWIAMKALEKDRRRRYETANDLTADVMRYLTDRPVEACPPSARYRLAKYARRHRAALTTAALVALSLVGGTATSLWQAVKARAAEGAAVSAQGQAEDHLILGHQAVEELYDHLASQGLTALRWAPLPRPFLRKVLPFYQRFAEARRVDPGVGRANLRIGEILIQLNQFEEAGEALRRAEAIENALLAVDPDDPGHLRDLAACLFARGEIPQAWEPRMEFQRRAIALRQQLVDRFPNVPQYRRELAASHHTLSSWHIFGQRPGADGKLHLDLGRKLREGLCAEDPDDPDLLCELGATMRGYSELHGFAGRGKEAEPYARRAHAIHAGLLKEHPTNPRYYQHLTWGCSNLGTILVGNGKYEEAALVLDQGLTMLDSLSTDQPERDLQGGVIPDHLAFQAIALSRTGDQAGLDRSVERLLGLLDRWRNAPIMIHVAWHLVQPESAAHAPPEATVQIARRASALQPESVIATQTLGMAEFRAGDPVAAIAAMERANELEHDEGLGYTGFFLAMAHHRNGESQRARSWYDRTVAWMDQTRPTDPNIAKYRDEAAALMGLNARQDEAKTPAASGEKTHPK